MKMNKDWRIIVDEQPPTMHMALDEVMMDRVANGDAPATLRFWKWQTPAVVLGRFQAVRDEVFEEMADKYGVEVVRRITGGGAMFTEPETVVTYSLVFPEEWLESSSIIDSYRELEKWVLSSLHGLGVDAGHQPVNDIVYGDQKIGGSAQARRNGVVLHHTMMAYDLDVEKMLKVLRIGKEKISDKAIKSAEKHVAPIRTLADISRDEVIQAMTDTFNDQQNASTGTLTGDELSAGRALVNEKFGTNAWKYIVDREIEGWEKDMN